MLICNADWLAGQEGGVSTFSWIYRYGNQAALTLKTQPDLYIYPT